MPKPESILKLCDAATQMKLAIANLENEETFRSCINAFISTARSVTMVLERECKHLNMKDWYKHQTKRAGETPLFKFFNEKRVFSIHKGAVQPVKKGHQLVSARFWHEEDEKKEQKLHANAVLNTNLPTIDARDIASFSGNGTMWAWFFEDVEEHMPGDTGNVLRLCEDYYACLKWIVEESIREQYRRGIRRKKRGT